MNNFGKFLRQKRRELDLTQQQIANDLDVRPNTISGWEQSKHAPSLSDLEITQLARILQADTDKLYILLGKIPADIRQQTDLLELYVKHIRDISK